MSVNRAPRWPGNTHRPNWSSLDKFVEYKVAYHFWVRAYTFELAVTGSTTNFGVPGCKIGVIPVSRAVLDISVRKSNEWELVGVSGP